MKRIIASIIISFYLVTLCTKCSNREAEAKFEDIKINFGNKLSTDTIKGEFTLENIGDKDLIIEHVESSCGCTIPTYTKGSIIKNGFGKINFIYIPKSTDSGIIVQKIVVRTNAIKRLQILTVTGIIKRIN